MFLASLMLSTVAASRQAYSAQMLSNEIDSLPGAPDVQFKMFSGYVNVALPNKPARSVSRKFIGFHLPTGLDVSRWISDVLGERSIARVNCVLVYRSFHSPRINNLFVASGALHKGCAATCSTGLWNHRATHPPTRSSSGQMEAQVAVDSAVS
jgi:hypothetical protein